VIRSGVARMDLDALATTLAARAVRRATASEVRTATGQPIGGVSPVGWPGPLRVYVDQALRAFDVVWSAAGTPNAVFATTFQELLAITGGEAITVVSEVSR